MREANLLPEPHVRVAVTARAMAAADADSAAWTAFAGEILATEGQAPVPVGARVAGFAPAGADVRVPTWAVIAVPADLAVEAAALLPLAGVAARAARLAGIRVGEPARVIGGGSLAELVAAALRAAGAREVAVTPEPGADLPTVVVDTTGDPAMILRLLESAPRLARVVLAGPSRGRTIDVDFYRTVHQRGLEVLGVHDFGPLSAIAAGDDREHDLATAAALVGSARSNRMVSA